MRDSMQDSTDSLSKSEEIPAPVAETEDGLPAIPGKRYFTIGEVAELCQVKQHVLRYWEQEFAHIKPVKRRGNRRYYMRQDVLAIRQIRSLLYDQGYTIPGARARLAGEDEHHDSSQFRQLVRQTIRELEDIRTLLKRR
ncbi:MerR family transcriptional regulator [Parendozoicomonas haliclonae]|uniref:MerR family regulatory protein n=2 Tax=Parendozoicomonas haliclonae TaxID=1960125 RepID=A0A1X7AJK6_9GAMM|nr:MerR family regulatory protein [Parendozoicomonas haliclonae]